MFSFSSEPDSRNLSIPGTFVKDLHEDQSPISVIAQLIEWISPSYTAYAERAKLFPDTYGNEAWVSARINTGIEALQSPFYPRGEAAIILFRTIGIKDCGDSEDTTRFKGILSQFKSREDLHKAVSVLLCLVASSMCGFSGYEAHGKWCQSVLQGNPISSSPISIYGKPITDDENRMTLILRTTSELSEIKIPTQFSLSPQSGETDRYIDLESFRLEVVRRAAHSNGVSALLKHDASPIISELLSLSIAYSCFQILYGDREDI